LREARAGRPASAAIWFDRALDVDPLNASAHLDRGVILRNLGRLPEALASFERALALDPHLTAAHANRGVLLKELRQWDAALASLDSAIAQNPHMGSAHANRAAVLLELGRWRAALASCDEALRIAPHQAQAHCNRGSALRALGCLSESLASYDAAIHLDAGLAEAYSNRGAVLADLHEWEQARESYDAAIALRPDFAEARFNRSVIALLRGEFSGWMDYEWRWLNENGKTCRERRDFAQPAWRGKEPLAGRTILLFAEQGLGDTLQFCRYVPLVAALGATVILEVQKPLVKLLRGLPGISYAIARGEPLPAFDCHCPLLSLPLAFGTQLDTVPAAACYLEPDAALIAEWTKRLGDSGQPRIGLAWSGNRRNANDRYRSVALAQLIEALPPGARYFCLQTDIRETDRPTLAASSIVCHCEELDFPATAALCAAMDLVISVDTSIAHLSGAIGKRTWILLPQNGDWRWLLARDDSPWYESVRLFRQQRLGDWCGVLSTLNENVRRLFDLR